MVNIQHIMLNDTTQLVELCMSISTKGGLAQKDIIWWSVTGCLCTMEWANCCISRCLSGGKDTNLYSPEKKGAKWDEVQTWKN